MDVILIDDDSQIHVIIGKYLDRFGKEHGITINIKSLSDPVEGLHQLSEADKHFDAVILDLRMPKLGGDKIYEYLMREKSQVLESVMFVTGYRDDLEERFPEQNLAILDKPFRYELFAQSLRDILGSKLP